MNEDDYPIGSLADPAAQAALAREAAAARMQRAAAPGARQEGLATAIPEQIAKDVVTIPQKAFGSVFQYEDPTQGTYNPQPIMNAAMGVTGAPTALPGGAVGGAIGMGAVRDPNLWHGISTVRLPKPISEMQATHAPIGSTAEMAIKPADLQGGYLLPGLGDRSRTGSNLLSFNGYPLERPVPMQGGHGFMAEQADKGIAWASGKPVVSRLSSAAEQLAETGKPVYFPYTAMGERSVDFSHHVALPLAQAAKTENLTKTAVQSFDRAMKKPDADFGAVKNWPGLHADDLENFLLTSKGDVRNKFAKLMDTREFQDKGFPSVAEARFAVTDPRLLHAPTGAAGISVAKLEPGARATGKSGHLTYESDLPGQYLGGLGRSIPKEVFYPDLINAYKKAGYEPYRFDYLMARGLRGAPIAQRANQQWVDRVSAWMEKNPKELMKYAVPPAALGALAAQDNYQQ